MRLAAEITEHALVDSSTFGRLIRMDSPSTQGVGTCWFTLSAFDDGNAELAIAYARYERDEFRRLADTVLGGWLGDLIDWTEAADWSGSQASHLLRTSRKQTWARFDRLADLALAQSEAAIAAGQREWLDAALESMREAHIASNDLAVRLIQDLLTAVSQAQGEEYVAETLRVSYEHIWKKRYELWFRLTGHERLALSSEGMRAHYGGPARRGDFTIREFEDRYVMRFDPCGTGQVMRRGTDERDAESYLPVIEVGRTASAHAWSQNVEGMPYYCVHCPALMEHFPTETFGGPLRPVFFDLDPNVPCTWAVPKPEAAAAAAS